MTYAEKLKDPRWQKKRLEVLNRDFFLCKYCMDGTTTLHVHHLKYNGEPWEAKSEDLITLCEHCHVVIEHGKLEGENVICCIKGRHKESNSISVVVIANDGEEKILCVYRIINGCVKTSIVFCESFFRHIFDSLEMYTEKIGSCQILEPCDHRITK